MRVVVQRVRNASVAAAGELFELFVKSVRAIYPRVAVGVFQAHMVLSLANDGPVTIILE